MSRYICSLQLYLRCHGNRRMFYKSIAEHFQLSMQTRVLNEQQGYSSDDYEKIFAVDKNGEPTLNLEDPENCEQVVDDMRKLGLWCHPIVNFISSNLPSIKLQGEKGEKLLFKEGAVPVVTADLYFCPWLFTEHLLRACRRQKRR